jgi:hypothetical protein
MAILNPPSSILAFALVETPLRPSSILNPPSSLLRHGVEFRLLGSVFSIRVHSRNSRKTSSVHRIPVPALVLCSLVVPSF